MVIDTAPFLERTGHHVCPLELVSKMHNDRGFFHRGGGVATPSILSPILALLPIWAKLRVFYYQSFANLNK
jgi:hypothetical protein